MPITTPTIRAKLFTANDKIFAVAQPQVTTISLLYGVEVSAPSGFSANPNLDIHVFNNPKAALAFVNSLDSSFDADKWIENNFLLPDVEYMEDTMGLYYVTAQRAEWHDTTELSKVPLGISGCTYCDDPKPFIADVMPKFNLPNFGAFLTVVAVINNSSAIDVEDQTVLIKTITESASK